MIGDIDFNVSKLYGMLPAAVSGDPAKRTAADNQTVRNVFVIGPDKKVKLILVYPMTTGRNFDEVLRVIDSAAAHGETQGGDAGELEARRRRDHRRFGDRRGRQEAIPAGLEVAKALYPHRAATEGVTLVRPSVSIAGAARAREWSKEAFNSGRSSRMLAVLSIARTRSISACTFPLPARAPSDRGIWQ